MNRETLERMTKDELIELVKRQEEAINGLNIQRCDANAVIEHLVTATEHMKNLRCRDAERELAQDYMDDFVRQMYMKYPSYIVKGEE